MVSDTAEAAALERSAPSFSRLTLPEIGEWNTHADALRFLGLILNDEPGQRRMQLCEADDERFKTVRECEQHFMFACVAPETALLPDDRAQLQRCCDALGIAPPSRSRSIMQVGADLVDRVKILLRSRSSLFANQLDAFQHRGVPLRRSEQP